MIAAEYVTHCLLSERIVSNVDAAMRTTAVFILWQHGQAPDFKLRSVHYHVERLRRIGIDIRKPFDVSDFSGVQQ